MFACILFAIQSHINFSVHLPHYLNNHENIAYHNAMIIHNTLVLEKDAVKHGIIISHLHSSFAYRDPARQRMRHEIISLLYLVEIGRVPDLRIFLCVCFTGLLF